MLTLPGASPAPGFDDPLGVLLACHGRIERQCVTLEKLLEHLPTYGADAQAREAAQAILRYFNSAGRHHHEDEEADLFPLLAAGGDAQGQALVSRLLGEHAEMEAAWARLRPALEAVAAGQADALDGAGARAFIAAYAHHIALENTQLLPLARERLAPAQIAALGAAMAARRGIVLKEP